MKCEDTPDAIRERLRKLKRKAKSIVDADHYWAVLRSFPVAARPQVEADIRPLLGFDASKFNPKKATGFHKGE